MDKWKDRAHDLGMARTILVCGFMLTLCGSATALDQPVIWRDPDSGCAYWLTPQGGIAPRYRSNGLPDCPASEARSESVIPLISEQAARDLARAMDAIKRQIEILSDRVGRR
jgi:hypothetical protein